MFIAAITNHIENVQTVVLIGIAIIWRVGQLSTAEFLAFSPEDIVWTLPLIESGVLQPIFHLGTIFVRGVCLHASRFP